MAKEDTLLQFS
ncbi:unnamed protein product [Linum tenue]|uniref:Uncharacterized protein n=1 Tax=Linum tenue TaxID=586396 RepID=A0AAV0I2T8_9ROSI|nr:unnamed protein product [Linum tenue]CAI0540063.1 unnamed protein product [Linum tenue]